MTSSHDPYQIFFDLVEEWRKKKTFIQKNPTKKNLKEYFTYCQEHFAFFSAEYVRMSKPHTQKLCQGFIEKAKSEMRETKEKLKKN